MHVNKLLLWLQKAPHNRIIRTETISYPRSGHGALRNILMRYFGNKFHYCAPRPIGNCGCEEVPCSNPATNYSKNHDFGLYEGDGIDIQACQQYLVQYRNPVRSIVSNYYLYLKHSPDKHSIQGWHEFAHQEIDYWNNLIDKWVINAPTHLMLMTCGYDCLVSNPLETVSMIVSYMTHEPYNSDRLERAIDIENIRSLNNLLNFHYFDKGFFNEIELLAGSRLERLAIPTFEDSV